MKTIMGIDPGMGGALASISDDEKIVYDMPTFEITKGGSVRRRIDIPKLLDILRADGPDHIFIERVSAQPGNGATHAFTYGFGCGVIEACVTAAGIPFTYVAPQTWKKALNCPKDKDGARMRASQLLPDMRENWPLKKHDGRAEAALIALFGRNQILGAAA